MQTGRNSRQARKGKQMQNPPTETTFDEGLKALNAGRTNEALEWFDKAMAEERVPRTVSYFAYCRAKEKGKVKEALALCMEAMKEEPKNSDIYLNLGRIYMVAGQRKSAIRAFDLGLRCGKSPQIEKELSILGRRKAPPIPFLPRSNPINRYLGMFLAKLGLR